MATPVAGTIQEFFVSEETTFDTNLAAVAGDGIALESMELTPSREFIELNEKHDSSMSLQGEVPALWGGTWSAVGYVKPNAAGTAPDYGAFLKACGMTEAHPASDTEYTLNTTQPPTSLQLIRRSGDELYEVVNGVWVESFEVEVVGNGLPKLTWSGGFATYGWMFGDPETDTAGYSVSATSITLAAADAHKVGTNARVKFGSEDNSGSGYLVTAVSSDGLTLTISPGLAGGLAASAHAVAPITPTGTHGGSVQGAVDADLSIGGASVGFIEYKGSLATGIIGLDKEATANKATKIALAGPRRYTAEMKFYFLDENTSYLGDAWNGTTQNIICRVGPSTAGQNMKFETPALRIGVSPVEMPDADVGMWTGQGKAQKSATNEDEFKISLD